MDLIGLDVRERQRKMKFTVLRRESPWSADDVSRFISDLGCFQVHQHPQHPGVVILDGEYPRVSISLIIRGDFEHEVVTGRDNPRLPFIPPSF